jgi:predicted MFS family arabinose efflux permease
MPHRVSRPWQRALAVATGAQLAVVVGLVLAALLADQGWHRRVLCVGAAVVVAADGWRSLATLRRLRRRASAQPGIGRRVRAWPRRAVATAQASAMAEAQRREGCVR